MYFLKCKTKTKRNTLYRVFCKTHALSCLLSWFPIHNDLLLLEVPFTIPKERGTESWKVKLGLQVRVGRELQRLGPGRIALDRK